MTNRLARCGTECAYRYGVIARRLEDLQVWQRAKDFADAVSGVARRAAFERDRQLRDQLNDSALSVLSNIGEGFGQKSDRAFASYLYIARGSNNEAAGQLAIALTRCYLRPDEYVDLIHLNEQVGRMLTCLIGYLRRSDRKTRG